jgi:hypothetical protein
LVRAVTTLALVTAISSFAAASTAFAGGPTAAAVYRALLTTPIPAAQMPEDFNSASVASTALSNNAKRHHAIGEVEFDIDDDVRLTRDNAFITYAVFPSRADAVNDYQQTQPAGKVTSRLAAPGGLPRPAQLLNGSVSGINGQWKTVMNGVTGLEFVDENVVIAVITVSTSNSKRGDVPGAISLARLALAHLRTLGGG